LPLGRPCGQHAGARLRAGAGQPQAAAAPSGGLSRTSIIIAAVVPAVAVLALALGVLAYALSRRGGAASEPDDSAVLPSGASQSNKARRGAVSEPASAWATFSSRQTIFDLGMWPLRISFCSSILLCPATSFVLLSCLRVRGRWHASLLRGGTAHAVWQWEHGSPRMAGTTCSLSAVLCGTALRSCSTADSVRADQRYCSRGRARESPPTAHQGPHELVSIRLLSRLTCAHHAHARAALKPRARALVTQGPTKACTKVGTARAVLVALAAVGPRRLWLHAQRQRLPGAQGARRRQLADRAVTSRPCIPWQPWWERARPRPALRHRGGRAPALATAAGARASARGRVPGRRQGAAGAPGCETLMRYGAGWERAPA